jgi:hypothetical protein
MTERMPVLITMNVEGFGGSVDETHEVPRAEWESMSRVDRLKLCEEVASDHAGNHVGWGWNIEDPDDYASVASVIERPTIEITKSMVAAFEREGAGDYGDLLDIRAGLRAALEATGFTVTDGGDDRG